MDNMLLVASRLKLRFETPNGLIGTEDLWDLPLTSGRSNRANLDDIAKALFTQLKETSISFVVKEQKSNDVTQLKFDIVKSVIDTMIAEKDAAAIKTANREKKQQILAIIAQKQNENLAGSSLEDLLKMVEALES